MNTTNTTALQSATLLPRNGWFVTLLPRNGW